MRWCGCCSCAWRCCWPGSRSGARRRPAPACSPPSTPPRSRPPSAACCSPLSPPPGVYDGPLDGLWGAATAEALGRFAGGRGAGEGPTNLDAAALATAFLDEVRARGWDFRPLDGLGVSMALPYAELGSAEDEAGDTRRWSRDGRFTVLTRRSDRYEAATWHDAAMQANADDAALVDRARGRPPRHPRRPPRRPALLHPLRPGRGWLDDRLPRRRRRRRRHPRPRRGQREAGAPAAVDPARGRGAHRPRRRGARRLRHRGRRGDAAPASPRRRRRSPPRRRPTPPRRAGRPSTSVPARSSPPATSSPPAIASTSPTAPTSRSSRATPTSTSRSSRRRGRRGAGCRWRPPRRHGSASGCTRRAFPTTRSPGPRCI